MFLQNGQICLECGDDFQEDNHIRSITKCTKCKYQTACSRAILKHTSTCTGDVNIDLMSPCPLGAEMHCICGYSSSEGNDLARHMATCDRKSAYDSAEAAQANVGFVFCLQTIKKFVKIVNKFYFIFLFISIPKKTVKCNMLDMLGLVPRDGEEEEEDSSDGLLIPADQQQQLLSKSIDRENDNDPKSSAATSTTAPPPNSIDDFNTQLSLDDLAPQSVAPQPEPDRTPQLSDEYQSLATPRVAYNAPQYDNNEYEMAPNN